MTENPYQPPQDISTPVVSATGGESPDEIRMTHIKHEASVRSVGILYYLGGILTLLSTTPLLMNLGKFNEPDVARFAAIIGSCIVVAIIATAQIVVGRGVRNLKPWARIAAIILSAIGLIGFPIGTLICAYILYLLLSRKGRRIFTAGYQDVIAATPEIRYKTSPSLWIALGIAVFLIIGYAAFAMW